jgi:hypothetical protein
MTGDDRKRRGAGRLIVDAIAEHEVERVGELSPAELAEEMKKEGRDPERAKAVAEKALAGAAAGADAPARDTERATPLSRRERGGARRLIEDALAEQEVERIGELSPEQLAAEMKKEGRDPARARAVAERALAAVDASAEPAAGKVVRLDERRRWGWSRTTLSLVAASFVGIAGYRALQGPGDSTNPPPTQEQERARGLREEAFTACKDGKASVCKDRLDRAKALDPEGERSREVAEARARIKQLEAAGAGER